MPCLLLIGGGRWAKIIAREYIDINPDQHSIVWVTKHCQAEVVEFAERLALPAVEVIQDIDDAKTAELDCCIVANAPARHKDAAIKALDMRLPTLVEKPLSTTDHDFNLILEKQIATGIPLGLNLLFHHANYFADLEKLLEECLLSRIEIIWRDTAEEQRYGDLKKPDYFTRQVDDMFPHCWSILNRLGLLDNLTITRATARNDGEICLFGKTAKSDFAFTISRFAKERERKVSLNGGEVILDFSTEPGYLEIAGTRTKNQWLGDRPLRRSLKEFIAVVANQMTYQDWPLGLHALVDLRNHLDAANKAILAAQRKNLRALLDEPDERIVQKATNLLLDLFLTTDYWSKHRPPVASENDRREFAAFALSDFRKRLINE